MRVGTSYKGVLSEDGQMASVIQSQRNVSPGRSSSMCQGTEVGMGLPEDRK